MRHITLTVATLQSAFDAAFTGIMQQGGCSTDGDECSYFESDAVSISRCAIGHLMTEDDAEWLQLMFPPTSLDDLIDERNFTVSFDFNGIPVDKLTLLQQIHDRAANKVSNVDADFIPMFHADMLAFAKTNELVVPMQYRLL